MTEKSICEQVQENALEKRYDSMNLSEKLDLQQCAIFVEIGEKEKKKAQESLNQNIKLIKEQFFKKKLEIFLMQPYIEQVIQLRDNSVEDLSNHVKAEDLCNKCFDIENHELIKLYKDLNK